MYPFYIFFCRAFSESRFPLPVRFPWRLNLRVPELAPFIPEEAKTGNRRENLPHNFAGFQCVCVFGCHRSMTFLAGHAGGHPSGCPHRAGLILSKKGKKGEEEEKRLSSISMQKRILPFLSTLKYVELFLK